ncbi:MAG: hypothetical protein ACI9KE_002553 [Polyangiales bacterium]|jgi:hypothetical protein
MNNDLLKTLSSHIDVNTLSQMAKSLGASPEQTQSAVGAALPMMLGGLARNTAKPGGDTALAAAVDKNHDGTFLGGLGGLLGGLGGDSKGGGGSGDLLSMAASMLGSAPGPTSAKSVDGAGILGHMFGTKQPAVEDGVSQASGLDKSKVPALMVMLAPMVMSAIGKNKKDNGLDAGGLAGMLQGASEQSGGGQGGGVFGALFDQDGDSNMAGDLAKAVGSNMLAGLFK